MAEMATRAKKSTAEAVSGWKEETRPHSESSLARVCGEMKQEGEARTERKVKSQQIGRRTEKVSESADHAKGEIHEKAPQHLQKEGDDASIVSPRAGSNADKQYIVHSPDQTNEGER